MIEQFNKCKYSAFDDANLNLGKREVTLKIKKVSTMEELLILAIEDRD